MSGWPNLSDLLVGIETKASVGLVGAPLAAGFPWAAESVREASARAREALARGVPYDPKQFTPHEWETVRVLVDLILPKDERSGSATEAGVPEFMDFMLGDDPDLQTPMRGGLAWLDHECDDRYGKTFVTCTDAERAGLLVGHVEHGRLRPGERRFRCTRDRVGIGGRRHVQIARSEASELGPDLGRLRRREVLHERPDRGRVPEGDDLVAAGLDGARIGTGGDRREGNDVEIRLGLRLRGFEDLEAHEIGLEYHRGLRRRRVDVVDAGRKVGLQRAGRAVVEVRAADDLLHVLERLRHRRVRPLDLVGR